MAERHLKVLLIEDNPGDVLLIREMLQKSRDIDFYLESADSLSAGLELLAKAPMDIMLLDLTLPDSYGIEAFHKAYAEASGMPIVVLSGSDDEDLAMSAVQAGAQDYLVKGQLDGHLLGRARGWSCGYASARPNYCRPTTACSRRLPSVNMPRSSYTSTRKRCSSVRSWQLWDHSLPTWPMSSTIPSRS